MGVITRQEQRLVTVSVDGRDLGIWDTRTGGETDSEETTYKEGGMQGRVSLGGSQMVGNVTLSRGYKLSRDHAIITWLRSRAGKSPGGTTIKDQPLDDDRNPFGSPEVYVGTLKRVTPPDHDSNSTDAAVIEIEVTIDGEVG